MSNTKNGKNKNEQGLSSSDLISSIFTGYKQDGIEKDKDIAKQNIKKYIQTIANNYKEEALEKYNVLVLHDSTTMLKSDSDNIYNAVTNFDKNKPLLLMLYSRGGDIGSAYLIGQLCREYSSKLVISVPRQAKSAATLLCCAANEIHMGSLSELGPIDPQIKGLPVLGLKNSIEHIASLVKDIPESAEMFAKYLNYSVKPIDIGYYERVAESAVQYAEKLLIANKAKLPKHKSAKNIAQDLVYSYKDHGFVLDKTEATKVFGDKIIKINTPEYNFSNAIYSEMSKIEKWFYMLGYKFYHIGALDNEPIIYKKT